MKQQHFISASCILIIPLHVKKQVFSKTNNLTLENYKRKRTSNENNPSAKFEQNAPKPLTSELNTEITLTKLLHCGGERLPTSSIALKMMM